MPFLDSLLTGSAVIFKEGGPCPDILNPKTGSQRSLCLPKHNELFLFSVCAAVCSDQRLLPFDSSASGGEWKHPGCQV